MSKKGVVLLIAFTLLAGGKAKRLASADNPATGGIALAGVSVCFGKTGRDGESDAAVVDPLNSGFSL